MSSVDAGPEQLAAAAEVARQVVNAIADGQWDRPTCCGDWSVRDLVEHVVAGNEAFAAALHEQPSAPERTAERSADLASDYGRSIRTLLDAFGQPEALKRVVSVPFGAVPGAIALHLRITELLVHGWDLARATGQHPAFPEDLAEQELVFARRALADVPPGRRPFAPPEPVAEDAAAIDRLAACLGRRVSGPDAGSG